MSLNNLTEQYLSIDDELDSLANHIDSGPIQDAFEVAPLKTNVEALLSQFNNAISQLDETQQEKWIRRHDRLHKRYSNLSQKVNYTYNTNVVAADEPSKTKPAQQRKSPQRITSPQARKRRATMRKILRARNKAIIRRRKHARRNKTKWKSSIKNNARKRFQARRDARKSSPRSLTSTAARAHQRKRTTPSRRHAPRRRR